MASIRDIGPDIRTGIATFSSGLLIPVIFLFDLQTPLGYAEWIFYIVPVILSYWAGRRSYVVIISALSVLFLVMGLFLSPPGLEFMRASINRIEGIAVIGILAISLIRQIQIQGEVVESEQRYRSFIESALDPIVGVDSNGRVLFVNGSASVFGQAPAVNDPTVWSLFPESVAEKYFLYVQGVFHNHRGIVREMVMDIGDQRYWFSVNIHPIHDGSGDVSTVQGIFRDITPLRQSEDALRASELRYRQVVESASEIIYTTDVSGNFMHANAAGLRLTGFSLEQLCRMNYLDLVIPDQRVRISRHYLRQFLLKEPTSHVEFAFRRADGEVCWLSQNATLIIEQTNVIGFHLIARDITERKQAEEALRKQAALLDLAHNAIFVRDMASRLQYWNHGSEVLYGWNEAVRWMVTHDLLQTQFPLPLQEIEREVTLAGHWKGELVHTATDGRKIVVDSRWAVQRNERGEPVAILEVNSDITARKQVEDALRLSERKYRTIFESTPVGIYQSSREGKFITVNGALVTILGYDSVEDLVRCTMEDVYVYREHREELIQEFGMAGSVSDLEVQWKKKDGTPIWVQLNALAVKDEDGTIRYFEGYVRDITEHKKADEALRYRLGLESIISAVSANFINVSCEQVDMLIDQSLGSIGSYTGVDRSYIFLFSEDGAIMKNTHEWCADGIRPEKENLQELPVEVFPWWMANLRRSETIHVPRVSDLPDDAAAERDILQAQDIQSVVVVPMVLGTALVGFMGFDSVREEKTWSKEDITLLKTTGDIIVNALERTRSEATLLRGKELAEQASALKDSFIATISHEIRTPVNIILGYLHLIQDADNIPNMDMPELVGEITSASERLTRTVDMVLNLSRYQAGDLKAERRAMNLSTFLSESVRRMNILAGEKNLVIDYRNNGVEHIVLGDEDLLGQAVQNLLDNAIKFTPSGSITVSLTNTEDGGLSLAIADTGIGISEAFQQRIFEPYTQESTGYSRRFDGIGLGLALVKRYLDVMGYMIAVSSRQGHGSVFTIEIPKTAIVA